MQVSYKSTNLGWVIGTAINYVANDFAHKPFWVIVAVSLPTLVIVNLIAYFINKVLKK